ncbi:hypothetical protein ABPG77_004299 [Micractinium sp. CCAP 211/92]
MAVEAVGCVIQEGSGFLALFPRNSYPKDHGLVAKPDSWPRVGLYATEPEAQRVVDLLRLKEALDSGTSPETVPLHLPLEEYMGNESTMQYLRDHEMAAVWATFHACGAEQLQPASDPYAAGSGGGPVTYAPSGAVTTAPSGAVVGAGGPLPAGIGRNWWEQLSDEEVAEAGGVAAQREGGAVPSAAQHGQQQAQQGQPVHEEGAEHHPPSAAGPSSAGGATREGTPSGRPRRAAALRNPNIPSMVAAAEAASGGRAGSGRAAQSGSGSSRQHQLSALAARRQAEEEQRRREQLAEAAEAAAAAAAAGEQEQLGDGPTPKKRSKTIIFPPVPASMKCNQCVNCQNPQRKRPCVLARRRLLELLREQEEAAAAAEEAALEAADAAVAPQGAGASKGQAAAPTAAATASTPGAPTAAAPAALEAGGSAEPSGTLRSPAAAIRSALSLPSRKQLYPIIPPSERCGRCKPCLNPKLKKACREARQRQLEAGLAPPFQQMLYNQHKALASGGAGGMPIPAGSPTAAAAAAAAAGAVGRARVPPSVATAAAVAAGRQLGPALIGCRLRIYWPGMRRWYEGRISAYDAASGQHHIDYDDGDQQDHVLGEEKYILLDPPKAAEKELPAEPANQNGKADAQLQHRGNSAESPAHTGRKGSGDSFAALGGSLATAPDTPAAAAAGAAGATPMLLRSSPMGPAAAAAAEAVVQLPAALAACCRRGSEMAAAAAAAGVTAILVGRFMAAFSCRMSEAQRQEHAAFLMPLLEAECYEGVQASRGCFKSQTMLRFRAAGFRWHAALH